MFNLIRKNYYTPTALLHFRLRQAIIKKIVRNNYVILNKDEFKYQLSLSVIDTYLSPIIIFLCPSPNLRKTNNKIKYYQKTIHERIKVMEQLKCIKPRHLDR